VAAENRTRPIRALADFEVRGSRPAATVRRWRIDALTLAIEQGYNNVGRLGGDFFEAGVLWNLHNHPAFAELVETMKGNRLGR